MGDVLAKKERGDEVMGRASLSTVWSQSKCVHATNPEERERERERERESCLTKVFWYKVKTT